MFRFHVSVKRQPQTGGLAMFFKCRKKLYPLHYLSDKKMYIDRCGIACLSKMA